MNSSRGMCVSFGFRRFQTNPRYASRRTCSSPLSPGNFGLRKVAHYVTYVHVSRTFVYEKGSWHLTVSRLVSDVLAGRTRSRSLPCCGWAVWEPLVEIYPARFAQRLGKWAWCSCSKLKCSRTMRLCTTNQLSLENYALLRVRASRSL